METADRSWRRGEGAREAGRAGEAVTAYRRTLALVPDFAPAHANLALVLGAMGAAEAEIRRAIALLPDHPLLRFNLGNLLEAAGRAGAGGAFRRSLALDPAQAATWLNLGVAVQGEGQLAKAEAAAGRALALSPFYAEAWNNLANVRRDQGRIRDALAAYGQALALRPGYADADRNRLAARLYLDDDDEIAGREAASFVSRHGPRQAVLPARTPATRTDADPERPLRLGLLSSDLGDHPVGRNMAGFIRHRDRAAIGLAVYDSGRRSEAESAWFRARADLWRDVAPLDDRTIAEIIRSDRIDVLVGLAGRFDRNRPLVAAWRAAPVQAVMHDGGPSGMGAGVMGAGDDPAIDAWITDAVLHPPDDRTSGDRASDRAGGDRLVRLPVFYNFQKPDRPPPVRRPDPDIVFGSFSNPAKLSPPLLAAWGRILAHLPEARLQLKYRACYGDPAVQARIRVAIAAAGGNPARLVFLAAAEDAESHLQRYGGIDLALDPFPFSGATTSFEALAMGVPVLTFAGHAAIGRTTAAILEPLGLDELVAVSQEDYVARALRLASDRSRLGALRDEIPRRLQRSSLLDGEAYAAALSRAFRQLWRDWCRKAGA